MLSLACMYLECQSATSREYPDIIPKGMESWGCMF